MAADVAGVIRCLGLSRAVVVGHGWGAIAAWSMAALDPQVVRGLVPVSMPHPQRLRQAALRDSRQRAALRFLAGLQLPFWPERSLTADDGARVERLLRAWSADAGWLDDDVAATYRAAFCRWPTAHTAVEYYRWAVRSAIRPDGLGYLSAMRAPIPQPMLQVHGARDPMILPTSVDGSEDYVHGPYTRVDLDTGHFPHEEAPQAFSAALVDWLVGLP
jgi:pimeloyl-ACP methyl ester carboxylesterase